MSTTLQNSLLVPSINSAKVSKRKYTRWATHCKHKVIFTLFIIAWELPRVVGTYLKQRPCEDLSENRREYEDSNRFIGWTLEFISLIYFRLKMQIKFKLSHFECPPYFINFTTDQPFLSIRTRNDFIRKYSLVHVKCNPFRILCKVTLSQSHDSCGMREK